MSSVDLAVLTLAIVMVVGVITFLFSGQTGISYVPILILLGIAIGPVLHLVDRSEAHSLFDYARVFGLVIILFAEGHNLKWPLLKRHVATIGILDTVGLLGTVAVAAFAFSWLLHVPLAVGFLFGAIIGATDPATLIPLFKQHTVPEDMRAVIVSESIFNDPLGIVLTMLAIALLVPQADSAKLIEAIAQHVSLLPAAVLYFLYEVLASAAIGVAVGLIGYRLIHVFHLESFPELYSFALAFGGFAIGEAVQASGYLVATVTALVLGNHELFFPREDRVERASRVIDREHHFNEILATLATVVIFILLGAGIDLQNLMSSLWVGIAVALVVVFVARPLATLSILPLRKWSLRECGFMAFEGPRGVVASALAGLPLALGLSNHDKQLIAWGESILAVTVITILVSVILETLWIGILKRRWLDGG
ncbi:cation:proton antiporter [Acidihalobacter ferrooxydans]|uniref:Sodium:proton antiporter n=1 Tax=Acidihalobacter ferrooxydans TaxID=1765967 RepID=A0A1P8UK98_9GAMM|nr:sodium:proton antiporter [Acidihalobacter ferrooxydans]APZ44257.1 sodium:proton antiporter [Acidihalobacter ferrooxydans]